MTDHFNKALSEFLDLFDRQTKWLLPTSADNQVFVRMMSTVRIGEKIYFQTDKNFKKCAHIKNNPNVALGSGNCSVAGRATLLGHPCDPQHKEYYSLYEKLHPSAFKRYTHLPVQVVIEVEPETAEYWEYDENKKPWRRTIDFKNKKVTNEEYKIDEEETK